MQFFSLIFMIIIFIFGLSKNLFLMKSVIYLYLIFLTTLILFLIRLNIKNFKFIDYHKIFFKTYLRQIIFHLFQFLLAIFYLDIF